MKLIIEAPRHKPKIPPTVATNQMEITTKKFTNFKFLFNIPKKLSQVMKTVCLYAMHVLPINPMDSLVLLYKYTFDGAFRLASCRIVVYSFDESLINYLKSN